MAEGGEGRMRRVWFVAGLIVLTVAAGALVVVFVLGPAEGRLVDDNYGDPIVERPLVLRQDGQETPLRTGTCEWLEDHPLESCGDRRFPRQAATARFDPARPFRLTFTTTSRLEMSVGRRRAGKFQDLEWSEGTVQCIDSRCVSAVRFPPRRSNHGNREKPLPVPRAADTLRIVVFGDPIEGAEIAIKPRRLP